MDIPSDPSPTEEIHSVIDLCFCPLGFDAGPIPDMGPYPINAIRNIYGLEPTEVTAIGFKTPGRDFLKMEHDTISVTLRFPGDRMASFTVGYAAAGSQGYKLVGTKGRSTFNG